MMCVVHCGLFRYAGVVVFTIRVRRPQSVAGRIWNLAQDAWAMSPLVLIVLRLTGVIAWSWWWVLSPLWISGILLAAVLCAVLVLILWGKRGTSRIRRPALSPARSRIAEEGCHGR
jgi:hypothetical protein